MSAGNGKLTRRFIITVHGARLDVADESKTSEMYAQLTFILGSNPLSSRRVLKTAMCRDCPPEWNETFEMFALLVYLSLSLSLSLLPYTALARCHVCGCLLEK